MGAQVQLSRTILLVYPADQAADSDEAQGTTDDAHSNLRRNGAVASAAERRITSRRQSG